MLFMVAALALGQGAPTQADDNAELAKLVQKMVVKELPKEFADASEWGKTIPIPPKLPLPNLRTRVKVGDHDELPHGLWKRIRVWFENPAKDLTIQIRELKPLEEGKGYRVGMDVTAALNVVRDLQHWQKGLATLGVSAQARATVTVSLEMDVALSLVGKDFPPQVKVEPKVIESKILLKEFELQRVSPLAGFGTNIEGEKAKEIGNDLRGLIQARLSAYDAEVRDRANAAIAQALREGKGNISADKLFKALNSLK